MHDWLRDKLQLYEDDGCVFWSGINTVDRDQLYHISYSSKTKTHTYTQTEHIIVMKKTPNTVTDEDRNGIIDPVHATYSANRLEIIAIVEKYFENKDNIINLKGLIRTYKVGDIVNNHKYALNYETVYCMIHTDCKSNHGNVLSGVLKAWYVNGSLMAEYNINTKEMKRYDMEIVIEDVD
jgi:hypothetical protein